MHPKFVKILCCPKTGEELDLIINKRFKNGTIKNGLLVDKNKQNQYPILNGVPRFVDKEYYSSSFGYEWAKWPKVQFEPENIDKPMQGHTTRMFEKTTKFLEIDIKDKTVVEFGCGPGRFLDIIRKRGGTAIGIDMSLAVESARRNFKNDKNVLIVQGDILNSPFKENVFDCGYTIGVLHHTPNPARGLQELVKTVNWNGKIACCVYSKNGFYNYPSVRIYRKVYKFIYYLFGRGIATKMVIAYSYFASVVFYHLLKIIRKIPLVGGKIAYLIEKFLIVNLNIPDIRWRILDTFDAITPYRATAHTPEEVKQWFLSAGIRRIQQADWCNTSFIGIKS